MFWIVSERLACVGEIGMCFGLEVIVVQLHTHEKAMAQSSGKACAQATRMTLF